MGKSDFEILCVDDDQAVLEVTLNYVTDLGFGAIGKTNVEDACDYIKKNHRKIVLILSDLRMDNNDGLDFKKKLKAFNCDIPFIIITGYWSKELSAQAMELGIDAFIEKPVTLEILNDYVEKFSEQRLTQLEEEREMVEGFIDETSPMLNEIESLILELEENPNSEQTLSIYFRLLHTIKGTASCVGLKKLGDFTHHYEDFVNGLRSRKYELNTDNANVLLEGLDGLRNYFELVGGQGHDDEIDVDNAIKIFTPTEGLEYVKETSITKIDDPKLATSKTSIEDEKMTVSMKILDQFMEESGELTVIRNSIIKTVKSIESKYRDDHDIELLNDLLDGMHNVTSQIQSKITSMRKVQLAGTFRPFKRLVRDLSKQLGKKVDFEVVGDNLYVDNIIAKLFSNTLIHIFRNSLDHGIETAENRLSLGKSEQGTLKLTVKEQGEDIHLTVEDDGKGINPEIIRKKIIEKELLTAEETEKLSDLQVINYIFESGFSTAEQVSDLSGRGVGMDMVRGSFENMGGDVFVTSEVGKGSCFKLIVPIPKSVLIINTLHVMVCDQSFMIPMDQVAEVVRYETESENTKMYIVDNTKMLNHNSEMITLLYLSDILGITSEKPVDTNNIVILRVGRHKYGIIVDSILDFEEVVSKKLVEMVDENNIFMGASIMGTGEVAMILCAEGVANYCGIKMEKDKTLTGPNEESINQGLEQLNEYMTFKYTKKDYLGIELEKVLRLERFQYSDIEYTGNNALIHYLGKSLPLIDPASILGFREGDILSKLSNNDEVKVLVIKNEDRLIGVVTYDLDEIHQTHEKLETEVYKMNGLLGSVFIKGKTLNILDTKFFFSKMNEKKKLKSQLSFSTGQLITEEVA